MGRTKIDWADYTINPVKGLCPMACPYCYARRMYKRFHWDETIRYSPIVAEVDAIKKPSRIFVGSTMELFGDWVQAPWLSAAFETCRQYTQHTFIFLTKQPQNLPKEWPDNCWVGVSVCNDNMLDVAVDKLEDIQAKTKFISFEPLLERLTLSLDYAFYYSGISWTIIGQQTPPSAKTSPKIEWVREIVEAADKAGVPVFLKNNLAVGVIDTSMDWAFSKTGYRQEFPVREEER